MADCTSFDSLLVSWLYDELEPAEATRFTRHIEGCDACWRTAKTMIRIRVLMRELPEPPPPAAASVRILREAAQQTERARRPGPWAWLVSSLELFRGHPAAAAVATLVLVAGVAGALLARGQLEQAAPAPWLAGARAPLAAEATHAPGDAVVGAAPAAPEPQIDRLSELAAAGPDRTGEPRERASGTRGKASPGRTAAEPESSKRREGGRQRPAPERPRAPAAQVMDLALAGESDAVKERQVGHEQAVTRAGDGSGAGLAAGLAAGAPRVPDGAAEAAGVPPVTATARSEAKPDDDSEHAQSRQSARRRDQRPPSEAMHDALRTALREQECARAVRIAEGIRARDPGYYRSRIAGGKELAACRKAAAPDTRAGQGGASKTE